MQEQQISDLRLAVLRHRYRYYVLCDPTISDYEYDVLETRLRLAVTLNPEAAARAQYANICPTSTVGSELEDSYPLDARTDG